MPVIWTFLIVVVLAAAGYIPLARMRAVTTAGGDSRRLHSRPGYYGWNAALWTAVPAVVVMALWRFFQPDLNRGLLFAVAMVLAEWNDRIAVAHPPRDAGPQHRRGFHPGALIVCSSIAILTTLRASPCRCCSRRGRFFRPVSA